VPDMRGCVLCGFDEGTGRLAGLYTDTFGAPQGQAEVGLTVAQLPAHQHTGSTEQSGQHQHNYNALQSVATGSWIAGDSPFQASEVTGQTDWASTHAHAFWTDWTGQNMPHNNCQVAVLGYWIIKAVKAT